MADMRRESMGIEVAVLADDLLPVVDQQQVLARLQLLERQVVGGEQAKNKDLKEKHKRRKRFADERRKQLLAALQNADEDSGDWVLLNVYDSIQEEVRAKSKLLEKMQRKLRAAEVEIKDLQSEFQLEKIDYLATIRRQERDSMLLQQLLEQVQPLIRRDCNYSNLEKIRHESCWDEDNGFWKIPQPAIIKTSLPVARPDPHLHLRPPLDLAPGSSDFSFCFLIAVSTGPQNKPAHKTSAADNGEPNMPPLALIQRHSVIKTKFPVAHLAGEGQRLQPQTQRTSSTFWFPGPQLVSSDQKGPQSVHEAATPQLMNSNQTSLAEQLRLQGATHAGLKLDWQLLKKRQQEEDRYRLMLSRSKSENIASNYFRSKRASHILSTDARKSLTYHNSPPGLGCPLSNNPAIPPTQAPEMPQPRPFRLESLDIPFTKAKRKKSKNNFGSELL
ncbi:Kinesin-like protein kif17 [Saguinus oedipus]|uniref:Kinesin-like protein kif17 n=1 Tax=Saguinus oedipus TaxID=9490 RepID=A0ABQ9V9Q5_SAGOE|nr:Kinesin-like protein kif17 [Saguinus oedipus]